MPGLVNTGVFWCIQILLHTRTIVFVGAIFRTRSCICLAPPVDTPTLSFSYWSWVGYTNAFCPYPILLTYVLSLYTSILVTSSNECIHPLTSHPTLGTTWVYQMGSGYLYRSHIRYCESCSLQRDRLLL